MFQGSSLFPKTLENLKLCAPPARPQVMPQFLLIYQYYHKVAPQYSEFLYDLNL